MKDKPVLKKLEIVQFIILWSLFLTCFIIPNCVATSSKHYSIETLQDKSEYSGQLLQAREGEEEVEDLRIFPGVRDISQDIYLNYNSSYMNYIYTISVEVGSPPQKTSLIVDLNSPYTILFEHNLVINNKGIDDYITLNDSGVDNFYYSNKDESKQDYYEEFREEIDKISPYVSLGMGLKINKAYLSKFCFKNNSLDTSEFCQDIKFVTSKELLMNSWFSQFNISNVGGILGFGYNQSLWESNNQSYSFWSSVVVNPQQFSMNIYPGSQDWPYKDEGNSIVTPSYIKVGGNLVSTRETTDDNYWLLMTSQPLSSNLNFTLTNFSWQSNDWYSNPWKGEQDLISRKATYAEINLGFNAIGLPNEPMVEYMAYLSTWYDDVYCPVSDPGFYCWFEYSCDRAIDQIDERDRFTFIFESQQSTVLILPLKALLREIVKDDKNGTSSTICQILVTQTQFASAAEDAGIDYDERYKYTFVFGTPFLQAFHTQVNYDLLPPKSISYSTISPEALKDTSIMLEDSLVLQAFRTGAEYVYLTICFCAICLWGVMTCRDVHKNNQEKKALEAELLLETQKEPKNIHQNEEEQPSGMGKLLTKRKSSKKKQNMQKQAQEVEYT